MLLLNQIVHHSHVSDPVQSDTLQPLNAVASQLLLTDCRYVLMDDLVSLCRQLVFDQTDLLADCFDLVRMPSRVVWLEWCQVGDLEEQTDSERIGLIVRSAEDGRSGTIQLVWEQGDGAAPIPDAVRIFFDFAGIDNLHEKNWFQHADYDLGQVLNRFWLEPRECAQKRVDKAKVAQSLWLVGPMVAAFCLLLLFKDEVELRDDKPDRLNAKRAQRGKPPLLANTQVHGHLFGQSNNGSQQYGHHKLASDHGQSGTHLHHVRGHFVRRGNCVFWRRPHLRGDPALGPVQTKTRILSG